ncbi:MAG TPA: hypothetical protein VHP38_15835 [Ruminiclostridium sp.]|nr:hypothetical protein [Ruminiclostridium sp.]
MNTLLIYDKEGVIISQMQGSDLREPIGVPFMWVEIPQGKCIKSIDVSGETPTPVFEDLQKSEVQALQEENTKIKLALAELAKLVGGTANG